MTRRCTSAAPALARFGLILLMLGLVQGCTHLDAVREFGGTAVEVSSYRDAGQTYQESVLTIASCDRRPV